MKFVRTITQVMWMLASIFFAVGIGLGTVKALRDAVRKAAEDEGLVEKVRDKMTEAKK